MKKLRRWSKESWMTKSDNFVKWRNYSSSRKSWWTKSPKQNSSRYWKNMKWESRVGRTLPSTMLWIQPKSTIAVVWPMGWGNMKNQNLFNLTKALISFGKMDNFRWKEINLGKIEALIKKMMKSSDIIILYYFLFL